MKKFISFVESGTERLFLWASAVICFFSGLYIALNRTYYRILGIHNYNLAPVGDSAHDAAVTTYPMLLGKQPFITIYTPFSDHRIVIERLWAMYDYVFTQGTQSGLPLRLSVTLWLIALLIIGFIIVRHQLLPPAVKLLLTGVTLAVVFSENSIINYSDSILMTWPYVLLFSLLGFISLDYYCAAFKNNLAIRHLYQLLVIFFVGLTLLTFNAWMLLWPVIFIGLLKNRCLKFPSALVWIIAAIVSYQLYFFHGWATDTGHNGLKQFLHHPIDAYLYLSRVLSIPLIASAQESGSVPTIIIAFSILSLGCLWFLKFVQREYRSAENILFTYFTYFFSLIITISIARFWMVDEASSIGLRFTTPSGIIMICLVVMSFIITYDITTNKLLANTVLSMLTMIWLIAFYVYGEHCCVYNLSYTNQWHIFMTTGVTIDDKFINAAKSWTNEYDINHWNYLLSVQKSNRKSAFSLWPSQHIRQSIEHLKYKAIDCHVAMPHIEINGDYRKKQVPGVLLTVRMSSDQTPITAEWDLLFLNAQNKIVGFAIASSRPEDNLINQLSAWKEKNLYWTGAINSNLLQGHERVTVFAASDRNQQYCQLGNKFQPYYSVGQA